MKVATVFSIFAFTEVISMDLGDDGKADSMQTIVDRAESLQEFYGYSSNDLAQTLVSAAGPRSTEWSHEVIIHMENLSEKDV